MRKTIDVFYASHTGDIHHLSFGGVAKLEFENGMLSLFDGDVMNTVHRVVNVVYWSETNELQWPGDPVNLYENTGYIR